LLLLTGVPYNIGFDLSRGHLSDLRTHCNYPTLCYKRLGQAPLYEGGQIDRLKQGRLEQYNLVLP
jgi:hypothetical protein